MNPARPSTGRLAWGAVLLLLSVLLAPGTASAAGMPEKAKNWTPPAYRIRAQDLSDAVVAVHPELLSITFHGVPPGLDRVYTMFAGSYPDRIGNPDDPDDVMVIETGITILDPRWHRTKDAKRKFVVQLPLRDAAGDNIGLLVLAYQRPRDVPTTDLEFLQKATRLRDELALKIPSQPFLFEMAR